MRVFSTTMAIPPTWLKWQKHHCLWNHGMRALSNTMATSSPVRLKWKKHYHHRNHRDHGVEHHHGNINMAMTSTSPWTTIVTTQEEQVLRRLLFNCKTEKIVLVMSCKYVPVTQSMLCQIFLMYVRTREHLNYGGQQPKKQLAVYGSDTTVTLKQGQSHQTW